MCAEETFVASGPYEFIVRIRIAELAKPHILDWNTCGSTSVVAGAVATAEEQGEYAQGKPEIPEGVIGGQSRTWHARDDPILKSAGQDRASHSQVHRSGPTSVRPPHRTSRGDDS